MFSVHVYKVTGYKKTTTKKKRKSKMNYLRKGYCHFSCHLTTLNALVHLRNRITTFGPADGEIHKQINKGQSCQMSIDVIF